MGLFNFFNKKPSLSVIELQNDLRILNDCASLIEKTVNPDVFFSRFDFLAYLQCEERSCKDNYNIQYKNQVVVSRN